MQIKRREFLQMTGAGLCAAALQCQTPSNNLSSGKPNIILCMADDQGWGDMAYTGHPDLKTPNFDEMAASALRFDHFYAATPVCSPTRGSVMTGRHPNRFGCFQWGHTLRPQEITIAEALKKAGYVTGHFGKWHLGSVHKGSPVNPGASGFDEWFSAPNFFDNNPILSREGTAVQTEGESSAVTVDAALEFIRTHTARNEPFLAVVWFGSPHGPHEALEKDRELYRKFPERVQHFYGEITAMDRAFGKLREEIKTLGIHNNTLLWYNSDNGGLPFVGSTGGRGHKGQVYEGGLRVPAIIEWPSRIPQPRTIDIPCTTSDIYPTLLEIADIQMKNQPPLDGLSLVRLIDGEMESRPKPVGFWNYPEPGIPVRSKDIMADLLEAQKKGKEVNDSSILRPDAGDIKNFPEDSFPGHAAWLDWPWKLHRIQEEAGEVKHELYNLDEDPEEKNDLVSQNERRIAVMKSELESWQTSVISSLNGNDYR